MRDGAPKCEVFVERPILFQQRCCRCGSPLRWKRAWRVLIGLSDFWVCEYCARTADTAARAAWLHRLACLAHRAHDKGGTS